MKMTIELNVPKEITDEYDIVPEFRKVHKGESYISGSGVGVGVGVWACLDKSSGLYIPLIKKIPKTSFDPSKLGDEYEVVCGWSDTSKMRPPKSNELCWDNESETVCICCIERKTPFIILRHKWKWPDGFIPGAVGVSWASNKNMYAWFGTPKLQKYGLSEYWECEAENWPLSPLLYPDLNLPNKDDWKNSYVPNPNHPANKKT